MELLKVVRQIISEDLSSKEILSMVDVSVRERGSGRRKIKLPTDEFRGYYAVTSDFVDETKAEFLLYRDVTEMEEDEAGAPDPEVYMTINTKQVKGPHHYTAHEILRHMGIILHDTDPF